MHARQETVGVWRQIYAYNFGLLRRHVVEKTRILVCKAVVILSPHVRSQENVQRRQLVAPRNLVGNFEPFGVLVKHGTNNVDECLVRVEESMPSRQKIAFQPS